MSDRATQVFLEHARVDSPEELFKLMELLDSRKKRALIAAAVADETVPEPVREALNRAVVLDPPPSDDSWLQKPIGYWGRIDTEGCGFE